MSKISAKPKAEVSSLLSAEVIRWSQASEWLFIPQQDRSRRTLNKVLEAAITLFCDVGFTQTTLADISRSSGVSVGTIYGRFEDKAAILLAILDAYYRSRREQFDDLFSEEQCKHYELEEVIAFYTDLIFSSFRQDSALIILADSERASNDKVADHVNRLNLHAATRFGEVLATRGEAIARPKIKESAVLYHDLISCLARISIQPTGPVATKNPLTNPAIEQHLVEMLVKQLDL